MVKRGLYWDSLYHVIGPVAYKSKIQGAHCSQTFHYFPEQRRRRDMHWLRVPERIRPKFRLAVLLFHCRMPDST